MSAIKTNPGLSGHFFPVVQPPVINAFSVLGAIICKSRARCLRGAPCRSAAHRGRGREALGLMGGSGAAAEAAAL